MTGRAVGEILLAIFIVLYTIALEPMFFDFDRASAEPHGIILERTSSSFAFLSFVGCLLEHRFELFFERSRRKSELAKSRPAV